MKLCEPVALHKAGEVSGTDGWWWPLRPPWEGGQHQPPWGHPCCRDLSHPSVLLPGLAGLAAPCDTWCGRRQTSWDTWAGERLSTVSALDLHWGFPRVLGWDRACSWPRACRKRCQTLGAKYTSECSKSWMPPSDGRATSAAQEGRARSSTSCQHHSHRLEVALKSLTDRAAPSSVPGGGQGASSPCCPAPPSPAFTPLRGGSLCPCLL